VYVGSAQVDNRRELFDRLELEPIVWGPVCLERIYGDGGYARMGERSRELFLA
jgi:hypothetical protein